ncbi:alpha/beta hydrolase [Haloarchaeobius sp. TZWSO28]|uniref:alpha/beta hydrolase n=1 Tax=Haloarchaeobius sp. TZWSO28 TaxID=3446119 RepID=UPI003EB77D19
MDALDPTLAAVIEDMGALPEWHELGVDEARRVEDDLFGSDAGPQTDSEDLLVPVGDHEVPVRVYRPAPVSTPAPGIVFAHGGGFVLGTLDSAEDLARRLATETGSVVVSVDYRLAPEHQFPAALDDVDAVLDWVFENAVDLGFDPTRLGVAGSSAGASLVVGAARRRQEDATPAEPTTELAFQALFYPMLDPACDRDSHVEHADGPLLTRRDLAWFWALYLGADEETAATAAEQVGERTPDVLDRSDLPPDLSPFDATDLGDLPPAVVVTGGVDPLRDEGRAYARVLAAAGVPVADQHHPGMCHGFLSLAESVPAAASAWDDIGAAIREHRRGGSLRDEKR